MKTTMLFHPAQSSALIGLVTLAAGLSAVAGDGDARLQPTAFAARPLFGLLRGQGQLACPLRALRYPVAARHVGDAAAAAASGLRMQSSNKFEIEGTLIKVMEPMTFPSGFVKREFVVRTDEMYPQEVKFELYKDKISLIDSYKLNEQVKISFNIKGSQWEGRFFTNLQAWRVERMEAGEGQLAAQAEGMDLSEWDGYGSKAQGPPAKAPAQPAKAPVQWDDDIPF